MWRSRASGPEGFLKAHFPSAFFISIQAPAYITSSISPLKDHAHFLYVQYMERNFDGQHVGGSISLVDLDQDKTNTEILVGAPHRYRYELKGAVLAYYVNIDKNEFQQHKDFNFTSKGKGPCSIHYYHEAPKFSSDFKELHKL